MKTHLKQRTGAARHPLLSTRQERKLAERIKRGDRRAAERLILANRRLVFRIARQYKSTGVCKDDLIQEGSVGLIRAAHNFDPSTRPIRFAVYAALWIRASIQRALSIDAASPDLPEGSPPEFPAPEDELLEQEERDVIHAALWRLNPFEAWLIRERFGLDHSDEEVADSSSWDKKTAPETTSDPAPSAGPVGVAKRAYHVCSYGRSHQNLSLDCGLSVHRIRLVESIALAKLRSILSP
jgi:RNA polymerase sigma factor (sigma-70 family)